MTKKFWSILSSFLTRTSLLTVLYTPCFKKNLLLLNPEGKKTKEGGCPLPPPPLPDPVQDKPIKVLNCILRSFEHLSSNRLILYELL